MPAAVRGIGQKGPDTFDLAALDVEQKHVRRVLGDLDGKLTQQTRLQRPNADDEEASEADGQQNDARLVARPRQMKDGVTQRE